MTSNEFETHPVFEKVEQIIVRLLEQEVREKIDLEKLNFFDSSCKYINDRLKLTIPTITPIAEFSTLSQEIESALVQINSFIGNGNIGH